MSMKREETVDYHIKSCWHTIFRMYGSKAAVHGLTTSEGFVLINIDSNEGTPSTKIAPMLGVEAGSLSRIINNLELKNLVRRVPDQADRRIVRIVLTDEGKIKKQTARRTVNDFNAEVRKKLSEEELAVFFRIMEKIGQTAERFTAQ